MSDLYASACTRMATGLFNWTRDAVFMALVDDSYVPDFLVEQTYADVPKSAVLLGPMPQVIQPTVVDGWCVAPVSQSDRFSTERGVHAVLVLQATRVPVPPDALTDEEYLLVGYVDEGYNFHNIYTTPLALYLIWPDEGVFRP